jgi:hypothetical protein
MWRCHRNYPVVSTTTKSPTSIRGAGRARLTTARESTMPALRLNIMTRISSRTTPPTIADEPTCPTHQTLLPPLRFVTLQSLLLVSARSSECGRTNTHPHTPSTTNLFFYSFFLSWSSSHSDSSSSVVVLAVICVGRAQNGNSVVVVVVVVVFVLVVSFRTMTRTRMHAAGEKKKWYDFSSKIYRSSVFTTCTLPKAADLCPPVGHKRT